MNNRKPIPPKYAERFLRWFLRKELAEEVQGDLEEQFYDTLRKKSATAARFNYWYQVFNYLRPFAISKYKSTNSNFTIMFKHNFLLTYRNFKRYKGSFFINLIGLSTGLACTLLIYLWVYDELNFDKFHEKDSRLFQIMENQQLAGHIKTQPETPDLLARTLKEEMPEIEYATAVTPTDWFGKFTLSANGTDIKAIGQHAEKDYFNVFSYDLISGDKNQVLSNKKAIVISEDLAIALFNTNQNVVGKTVTWKWQKLTNQAVISGIFKNIPDNSSTQFDFILPFETWIDLCNMMQRPIHWDNHGPSTFVVLKEGTNIDLFNDKIADFVKLKNEDSNVSLFLTPYSSRYLYGNYKNGVQVGGRISYVRLFSIIAIFILVIACINFMNLSTAKASRRIKEIGVKKAVGAGRETLIFQYLQESMLMTFLSFAVAMLIVVLVLPRFNELTGKSLELALDTSALLALAGIILFTGLTSGSYPAMYLSHLDSITVLKGNIKGSGGELWVRRGLVVFQFTLSVIFIVSVLVIFKQLEFIQTKNLGYDQDNIIYFDKEGKAAENHETFISELKKLPGVVNASSMGHLFTGRFNTTGGVRWEGKDPEAIIMFEDVRVYYDLIEMLDIEVIKGRSFSRDFSSEESKILLNETAIEVMELTDPIGKTISMWDRDRQVIGVVKDFHFESLHNAVEPLLFTFDPDESTNIMVKVAAGREKETLDRLRGFYKQFNPGFSFDYAFMDEAYQRLYVTEMRVGTVSKYFAEFAILISCLGLFGLAAFSTERRLKEIGIRKIMGSTEFGIVRLLAGDFTKLVLIAVAFALPAGYFISKKWLEEFAYRINPEWWFFAGAGLTALFIAWLAVGFQTIKAARINPVKCLKED